MCYRLGAFLAGRISLFQEPEGLESRERDPSGTIMNAAIWQWLHGSAAWLMTHEKTRGKFNQSANPYRVPDLDKIRHLKPYKWHCRGASKTPSGALGKGQRAVKSLRRSQLLSPECITMCLRASQGEKGLHQLFSNSLLQQRKGGISQLLGWSSQLLADTFLNLLSKALMNLLLLGSNWSHLPQKNGRKQV